MGVFVLKLKVNLETACMLGVVPDVHVLCIAGVPFRGRGRAPGQGSN